MEMKALLKRQPPARDVKEICYTDNQASIRWEEKGAEFSWNDQLYDVIRIVSRQGKTWLLCLEDGKEEALLDQMCAASQHHEKKNSHSDTVKIADDFTLHGSLLITRHPVIIPRSYSSYEVRLSQPALPVIAPPPRS